MQFQSAVPVQLTCHPPHLSFSRSLRWQLTARSCPRSPRPAQPHFSHPGPAHQYQKHLAQKLEKAGAGSPGGDAWHSEGMLELSCGGWKSNSCAGLRETAEATSACSHFLVHVVIQYIYHICYLLIWLIFLVPPNQNLRMRARIFVFIIAVSPPCREQSREYRRCLMRMCLRNPHSFSLGLPNAQK